MNPQIRPRVLCVEDDPDTGELLKRLLDSYQMTAEIASTAEQCLSITSSEHFDLYLLDAWLPDGDGVELCRLLRSKKPNSCFVFYSGAAFETDRQKAFQAGADAYILKPDVDQLIKTLLEITTPGGCVGLSKTPCRGAGSSIRLPSYVAML